MERIAKQPLIAAERQRARRARLKAVPDAWNAYLEKDRTRQRERRVHASPAELSQLGRQSQVSSAKYREKQRGNTNERVITPTMAYANTASCVKAKSKVMKAMPKSPTKARAILGHLTEQCLNIEVFNSSSSQTWQCIIK